MEVTPLVDAACERTGCSDFGEDTWQEGLDVLVQSPNDDAALSEMGEAAMTDQIVGYLNNRLDVERWQDEHPEIAEQPINAPLFGLGLPRTGSTALSFLLAQDPDRRPLRVWEPPSSSSAARGGCSTVGANLGESFVV